MEDSDASFTPLITPREHQDPELDVLVRFNRTLGPGYTSETQVLIRDGQGLTVTSLYGRVRAALDRESAEGMASLPPFAAGTRVAFQINSEGRLAVKGDTVNVPFAVLRIRPPEDTRPL